MEFLVLAFCSKSLKVCSAYQQLIDIALLHEGHRIARHEEELQQSSFLEMQKVADFGLNRYGNIKGKLEIFDSELQRFAFETVAVPHARAVLQIHAW